MDRAPIKRAPQLLLGLAAFNRNIRHLVRLCVRLDVALFVKGGGAWRIRKTADIRAACFDRVKELLRDHFAAQQLMALEVSDLDGCMERVAAAHAVLVRRLKELRLLLALVQLLCGDRGELEDVVLSSTVIAHYHA